MTRATKCAAVLSIAATAALAPGVAAQAASRSSAAGPPGAAGPAPVVNGNVASATVSAADLKSAAAYWTPERMAAARPLTPLREGAPPSANGFAGPSGPPSAVPGSAPADPAADDLGAAGADALPPTDGAAAPSLQSYPFPFQRWTVPGGLVKTGPWRVNGKVFFKQKGVDYVCSATSVVTPTSSRVWTAGHCVADGQRSHTFNTNVVFVPAYDGTLPVASQRPFGTWTATSLTTATAWLTKGDFARDLGAFTVAALNGKKLGSVVGSAGFAWNYPNNQQFISFGYPAAAPFRGTSMVTCIGATGKIDAGTPGPIGMGCDMTGGASGGSWVIGYTGSGAGFINGHNDYKYGAQPLAVYSPYFDTLANQVRCWQQGSGNGC